VKGSLMKKVIALIAAALLVIIAPPWIRYYGVAYELRNVPPEHRAFEFDISMIDLKYLYIDLLSKPLAVSLLLAAVALYVYERRRSRLRTG